MNPGIASVKDLNIKGRTVLLRLDLNVPLSGKPGTMTIEDDTRIREALPTIEYCIEQKARLVICSHLGRPDGKRNPEFSLEPVAVRLAELLGREVTLSSDVVGDGVSQMVKYQKGDLLVLLENVRYEAGEEANDPEFTRQLAHLCDVYVNDAFGTAHRKHSSTYGVPSVVGEAGVGFLIQKELQYLSKLIHQPKHPYVLVLGGAKVTDKLKAIDNLINFVDTVIVGGAMAYAFLSAQGTQIGRSKCEQEGVAAAAAILEKAKAKKVKILLPVDHIVTDLVTDPGLTKAEVLTQANIGDSQAGLDIGPKTVELFKREIAGAETIFWNGPMGFFEKPAYEAGTRAIAEAIVNSRAVKVAGGGDTLSAVGHFGLGDKFDLLSTGGGASLKFLEGKGLPCINVLEGKGGAPKRHISTEGEDDDLR